MDKLYKYKVIYRKGFSKKIYEKVVEITKQNPNISDFRQAISKDVRYSGVRFERVV